MNAERRLKDFLEKMREEAESLDDRDAALDMFIEEAENGVQQLETEHKVMLARHLGVHDEVMTDKSQHSVEQVLDMKLTRELATKALRKVWDQ